MRALAILALLISLQACGNRAAEQKIQQGRYDDQQPPQAPRDNGQGDNAGSPLKPGAQSDQPTSRPDQTGETDRVG